MQPLFFVMKITEIALRSFLKSFTEGKVNLCPKRNRLRISNAEGEFVAALMKFWRAFFQTSKYEKSARQCRNKNGISTDRYNNIFPRRIQMRNDCFFSATIIRSIRSIDIKLDQWRARFVRCSRDLKAGWPCD